MRGTVSDEFDAGLSTHAARSRGAAGGIDSGTRRLLLFAGGLGGALALIIGAWSLGARHHGPPPLITAGPGPVKIKPANPGGMQATGLDEPKPDPLAAAPPAPDGHAPAAGSAETLMPPPEPPAPAELHRLQTAPPATPASPAHPAMVASVARPAAPVMASPAAQAAHHIEVQLAALPSEAAAHEEWARLEKRFPPQFAHRKPMISRVVARDGHVFWRLRAGGFGDGAQAKSFCAALRGKGAACTVADF